MKTGVLLLLTLLLVNVNGTKHNFAVKHDTRTLIAPIGSPYGFYQEGCFGFEVFDYHLEIAHKHSRKKDTADSEDQKAILSGVHAGFLLKRFKSESAFAKYEDEYLSNSSHCIFEEFIKTEEDQIFEGQNDDKYEQPTQFFDDAGGVGILSLLRRANDTWSDAQPSLMYKFKEDEEGLYFLLYQVCSGHNSGNHDPKKRRRKVEFRTTFEIDFHYKNKDPLTGGDSYLTAGAMPLPLVFFYFFVSYSLCAAIWVGNIRQIRSGREGYFAKSGERPVIFPIHHLMSILMILKALTVFFESVRYHYIRLTGHAEFWAAAYYVLSFLKGVFLFTVILLVGSGWSIVKPFLADREKKIIFVVLFLQVLNNIALVALDHEAEGESIYDDWSAVLHMVDILCCCAVLIPIVWSVNSLEKSLENKEQQEEESDNETEDDDTAVPPNSDAEEHDEAEKARTLAMLKLFRSFYLLVVAYIYFTRIAVFLFASILDYRHTWVRQFVTELATLVFYVAMGLQFRPKAENSYQAVHKSDEHEISFTKGGSGSVIEMGGAVGSKGL